jgi:hypothetical protein
VTSPPTEEDELHELTDTGKILIRAKESLEEFDKQLEYTKRLGEWIRRHLRGRSQRPPS